MLLYWAARGFDSNSPTDGPGAYARGVTLRARTVPRDMLVFLPCYRSHSVCLQSPENGLNSDVVDRSADRSHPFWPYQRRRSEQLSSAGDRAGNSYPRIACIPTAATVHASSPSTCSLHRTFECARPVAVRAGAAKRGGGWVAQTCVSRTFP